jgi:hypothetical protein
MPAAIDSHNGNDQMRATSRRRGRRIAPKPRANFSATRALEALQRPPEPFRIAGQHEQHDECGQRPERRDRANPLQPDDRLRVGNGQIAIEDEHVHRQEHENRHEVEQTLEDDRGEGTGCAHPLVRAVPGLAREEIRTNQLAGARRQHSARGKADRRRAKRAGEGRRTERFEEVLPTQRANGEVDVHGRERQDQPFGPRPQDVRRHAPEIDVVEKPRDEADGKRQHSDGANVGSHRDLSAPTILPLHVVVVSPAHTL